MGEILFGSVLAVMLVALAAYYAWRQKGVLQMLRATTNLSLEDRLYLRRQVSRRLWCSLLMLVFAAMLVGSFFLRYEAPGEGAEKDAQREFAWQVTLYWAGALLVLFGIIALAAGDIWAIARFARRKQRQLESDRRAILESHIHPDRNGHV